jgi:hypothetical protein
MLRLAKECIAYLRNERGSGGGSRNRGSASSPQSSETANETGRDAAPKLGQWIRTKWPDCFAGHELRSDGTR